MQLDPGEAVNNLRKRKVLLSHVSDARIHRWLRDIQLLIGRLQFDESNEAELTPSPEMRRLSSEIAYQLVIGVVLKIGGRSPKSEQSLTKLDAPGSMLLSLSTKVCNQVTVESVLMPLVADWRCEYSAALEHGRKGQARWLSLTYTLKFLLASGPSRAWSHVRSLTLK